MQSSSRYLNDGWPNSSTASEQLGLLLTGRFRRAGELNLALHAVPSSYVPMTWTYCF